MSKKVVILGAIRTPVGAIGGGLAPSRIAQLIKAIIGNARPRTQSEQPAFQDRASTKFRGLVGDCNLMPCARKDQRCFKPRRTRASDE